MIDDKTRAAVMRELADEIDDHSMLTATNLRKRAAELDPPLPDYVWWRDVGGHCDWSLGMTRHGWIEGFASTRLIDPDSVEWKPARIPTPTQVIISLDDAYVAQYETREYHPNVSSRILAAINEAEG